MRLLILAISLAAMLPTARASAQARDAPALR
jgi:hypothetical protein